MHCGDVETHCCWHTSCLIQSLLVQFCLCNSDMLAYITLLMFELLRHYWLSKYFVMTAPTPVGRGKDAVELHFLPSCSFLFQKMLHLTEKKKKAEQHFPPNKQNQPNPKPLSYNIRSKGIFGKIKKK